jgi:hypothetical protein
MLTISRLLGGFFMFSLGLLFMMFGETAVKGTNTQDWVSKSILGIQVSSPVSMRGKPFDSDKAP